MSKSNRKTALRFYAVFAVFMAYLCGVITVTTVLNCKPTQLYAIYDRTGCKTAKMHKTALLIL